MGKAPVRRGRPKEPGKLYRFSLRYRPGADPPELERLLEAVVAAKGRKRADILRAALLGGASQAQETASRAEDSATETLLDDLFDAF